MSRVMTEGVIDCLTPSVDSRLMRRRLVKACRMLERTNVQRTQALVGADTEKHVLAFGDETDVVDRSIIGDQLSKCSRGGNVRDGECNVYG